MNARLTEGLACKLTLIAAPPGFGKTTLVTEWLSCSNLAPWRVAWVSLDAGDNDPGRFFTYVLRAIQGVEPEFGKGLVNLVQSSIASDPGLALVEVINALSAPRAPVVLVLDDYHVITNEAIHDALGYILEHQPPAFHIIMTSRAVPPLPLSRLRSRREINEIRADDLRFTVDEAAAFLNDVMGLDLPPERVAALERRTEGWIAGLLLAALSASDASDADAVLDSFGGQHRYVFDYLAEEVLRRQPEDVQRFLERTGILDRISAELAAALVGDEPACQEMLERLVASNLFTIPLDSERVWYRYHHLFGEFLAARYREQDPDGWREAHERACDWLSERDFRTEAVEHALAIQDSERLAGLIERHGAELVRRGRIGTVSRWLAALPEELIASRSALTLVMAWSLVLSRRIDEADAWLQRVDPSQAANEADALRLRAELAVCRATVARFRGDADAIVELSAEGLDYLHRAGLVNHPDYCVALLHLGSGYLLRGEIREAINVLTRAIEQGRRGLDAVVELNALSQLATAYGELGDFEQAEHWALAALEREREYGLRALSMAEGARWTLATVLREQKRFGEAHRLFAEATGRDHTERPTDSGAQAALLYERALVELAEGKEQAALATVDEAIALARDVVRNPTLHWRIEGLRVHIQMLLGNTSAGISWLERAGDASGWRLPAIDERVAIAKAWVALEGGDLDAADQLLSDLIAQLESVERAYRLAQARLLLAVLRARQGRHDEAREAIDLALKYAASQRLLQMPLETHPEVRPLLRDARTRYARSNPALAAFLDEVLPAAPQAPEQPGGLVELLTEREIEVLRLLAEGLPNREIAERLFVSVGTVKRHTHNIYSKLGVSNRTRAILRGRELGLLGDS